MRDTATANVLRAFHLLDGLAAEGLEHVVVSPGSRSTPLVLAAEAHPRINTHVVLDERCAAFFALGAARGSGRPAAVVATSGSAPAHWHPAAIEAAEGLVPLVLLSADRPEELQGCGANQTTDQQHLFGPHLRAFHHLPADPGLTDDYLHGLGRRAGRRATGPVPGPVHINCAFREPLVPERLPRPEPRSAPPSVPRPAAFADAAQVERLSARLTGGKGLIVCGWAPYRAGFAEAVCALSETLNVPLLADPLSGLRHGPQGTDRLITAYDTFLRDPAFAAAHRPEWVLRFGAMPVSKTLGAFIAGTDAILVDPRERWADPDRTAVEWVAADERETCRALRASFCEPSEAAWADAFVRAETEARRRLGAEEEGPFYEGDIIRVLAGTLPAGTVLFSGNSLPIRQIDTHLGASPVPLTVTANRGVSGIDGNLSTLLGIAAAGEGPAVGLVGDLAFWHDVGGLANAHDIDATLIVVNNGGGGIFGYLPQAGLEGFERYWLTPSGLEPAKAAELYGLAYTRVENAGAFASALEHSLARPGTDIIEAVVDREASAARHRRLWRPADTQ